MERTELIEMLKKICLAYTDILGVVILFGSYSRGDEKKGSDVDLYIEPKDELMTTSVLGKNKRYREFKYELYECIPLEFDLLSYGGRRDIASMRKSVLWRQIEKEGVTIYDQRAKAV